jgi:hypothetical protein
MKSIISTILIFCLFSNADVFAQTLKPANLFYRTIGDKIEIFYDLPRNADTLEIKVYFRKKSDPKARYRLKWASGSIGIGIFSGEKQKVVWNYKKEPPYLFTGSGYYYEVVVKKFKTPLRK